MRRIFIFKTKLYSYPITIKWDVTVYSSIYSELFYIKWFYVCSKQLSFSLSVCSVILLFTCQMFITNKTFIHALLLYLVMWEIAWNFRKNTYGMCQSNPRKSTQSAIEEQWNKNLFPSLKVLKKTHTKCTQKSKPEHKAASASIQY